jgi:hypothetical protein
MRPTRKAALVAALALGCAGASGPAPREGTRRPEPGLGVDAALSLLDAAASDGTYTLQAEDPFVSRIEDGVWQEVDPRATNGSGADVHVAVAARRVCSDWRFRTEEKLIDHSAEARASWFLLRNGGLVAWDHWTFGPTCRLENHFRPARDEDRDTERALLRFVDQRLPDPAPSPEIRFARGHAYLEAGRLKEAQRMLRSGDRAIDFWVASYAHHELSPERRAVLDDRERKLRSARVQLSLAIDRVERERGGAPTDPTDRYFRGLDP